MRLAAVMLGLLAAGCLAPGPAAVPPEGASALHLVDRLTGCIEAAAVLLVPFEQAASVLPSGFEPGDAQALFGTPVPTGRAAVYVNAIECAASLVEGGAFREAQVAVTVAAPSFDVDRPEAVEFYELAHWTPAGTALLGNLGNVSWPIAEGEPVVESVPVARGAAAQGGVEDGEGTVYSFRALVGENPTAPRLAGTGRFWHSHEGGTGWIEYTLDAPLAAGSVLCDVRAGSAAAQAAGRVGCTPGDVSVLLGPEFEVEVAARWFPGRFVASG